LGGNSSATIEFVGATKNGGIVLEPDSMNGCAPSGLWLICSSNGPAQPLTGGASILNLFESKVDAPLTTTTD
jgi:hypothetical protein